MVGAEIPRTECVCETGSLKFCAQRSARTTRSSLLFSSLLFSRSLLERVMMVNPFLVICSLYYSILSSRNSYQFCIISTSFAFFQRSGSSLIIFGRSTGFQPPGSSQQFCIFDYFPDFDQKYAQDQSYFFTTDLILRVFCCDDGNPLLCAHDCR